MPWCNVKMTMMAALAAVMFAGCDDEPAVADLAVHADGATPEDASLPGADAEAPSGPTEAEFAELASEVAELRAARSFAVYASDRNAADVVLAADNAAEVASLVSVDVWAPAAGVVTVNATASFSFGGPALIRCSLAKGARVHETGASVYARTIDQDDRVSAAATRGFPMDPGERATFHLLCDATAGFGNAPEWHDGQITATFNPHPIEAP